MSQVALIFVHGGWEARTSLLGVGTVRAWGQQGNMADPMGRHKHFDQVEQQVPPISWVKDGCPFAAQWTVHLSPSPKAHDGIMSSREGCALEKSLKNHYFKYSDLGAAL